MFYINSIIIGHNHAIVTVVIFTAFIEIEDSLAYTQKILLQTQIAISLYNVGNHKLFYNLLKSATEQNYCRFGGGEGCFLTFATFLNVTLNTGFL